MLVGLCSDTHDNLELARGAVETFEAEGVDAIIHCGESVTTSRPASATQN